MATGKNKNIARNRPKPRSAAKPARAAAKAKPKSGKAPVRAAVHKKAAAKAPKALKAKGRATAAAATRASPGKGKQSAPRKSTPARAGARKPAAGKPRRASSVSMKASAPRSQRQPVGNNGGMLPSKMAHIDDSTLAKIIAKLNEMRSESQGVVNQHMHSDLSQKEEVSDVGDDLDQAVTERDREFNLIMHQRNLRRLQQVDDAFRRIRDGVYGYCEGTEEPINPKRLMIMPLARFSLEYQEHQEKMLGRSPEDTYHGADEAFTAEE
jgi:DnaK suppressor protein